MVLSFSRNHSCRRVNFTRHVLEKQKPPWPTSPSIGVSCLPLPLVAKLDGRDITMSYLYFLTTHRAPAHSFQLQSPEQQQNCSYHWLPFVQIAFDVFYSCYSDSQLHLTVILKVFSKYSSLLVSLSSSTPVAAPSMRLSLFIYMIKFGSCKGHVLDFLLSLDILPLVILSILLALNIIYTVKATLPSKKVISCLAER